jgi:hypothetical protein
MTHAIRPAPSPLWKLLITNHKRMVRRVRIAQRFLIRLPRMESACSARRHHGASPRMLIDA